MQEGAPAPVGLVSSGNWGGGALLSFLEVDAPKPRPASGARGQRTWEEFTSSRQRQASRSSAWTGNFCLHPPPSSPFIIPTLNCRVQESKTSL